MQVKNIPYIQGMAGFFLRLGSTKLCFCGAWKNIQKYSYQIMVNFMVMNPMVFHVFNTWRHLRFGPCSLFIKNTSTINSLYDHPGVLSNNDVKPCWKLIPQLAWSKLSTLTILTSWVRFTSYKHLVFVYLVIFYGIETHGKPPCFTTIWENVFRTFSRHPKRRHQLKCQVIHQSIHV